MKQELATIVVIVVIVITLITYRMVTRNKADIVPAIVENQTLNQAANTDYIVFTESQARSMSPEIGKDETLYTPSQAEIEKAEQLFREKIPDFYMYYRQYYGTHRIVNDWKVINVRAFNKTESHPEWESELITVIDGGKNYFDGTANLNTNMVLFRYQGDS